MSAKVSCTVLKTSTRGDQRAEFIWYHEVLFEGIVRVDPKVKYPLCLESARACPPEDCGDIWGYADFVEAVQNSNHEQHEELLEWVGGKFDPEKFDGAKATKAMRKGLPDWRRSEWF